MPLSEERLAWLREQHAKGALMTHDLEGELLDEVERLRAANGRLRAERDKWREADSQAIDLGARYRQRAFDAEAEVKRLRAQVTAVETLHWRDEAPLNTGEPGYFCAHCSSLAQEYVNWPCSTRAALASDSEAPS